MSIKDDLMTRSKGFVSVREVVERLAKHENCSHKEAGEWLYAKRAELPQSLRKFGDRFLEDRAALINGKQAPHAPYIAQHLAAGRDDGDADAYGWLDEDLPRYLAEQGIAYDTDETSPAAVKPDEASPAAINPTPAPTWETSGDADTKTTLIFDNIDKSNIKSAHYKKQAKKLAEFIIRGGISDLLKIPHGDRQRILADAEQAKIGTKGTLENTWDEMTKAGLLASNEPKTK